MKTARWQQWNVYSRLIVTRENRLFLHSDSKKDDSGNNDADDGTAQDCACSRVFGSADVLVGIGGDAVTENF